LPPLLVEVSRERHVPEGLLKTAAWFFGAACYRDVDDFSIDCLDGSAKISRWGLDESARDKGVVDARHARSPGDEKQWSGRRGGSTAAFVNHPEHALIPR
jgi:hypothetical protein